MTTVPRRIAIARAGAVAIAAAFIGLVAWSAWQTQGPFPLPFATALYVASDAVVIIGLPPAFAVSLMATYALRRLAPRAERIWTFALAAIVVCGLACLLMLGPVLSAEID